MYGVGKTICNPSFPFAIHHFKQRYLMNSENSETYLIQVSSSSISRKKAKMRWDSSSLVRLMTQSSVILCTKRTQLSVNGIKESHYELFYTILPLFSPFQTILLCNSLIFGHISWKHLQVHRPSLEINFIPHIVFTCFNQWGHQHAYCYGTLRLIFKA